jgi:tRNA-specific 2-thiouridylase
MVYNISMRKINPKNKITVALSGGVDSAVSAALLVEQGFDVTGVFMKNWSGEDFSLNSDCPWEVDQNDAENVCKTLSIPFKSVNFEKQYRNIVVKYFFEEYSKGRTPNPDVLCNKEIKFKLFLQYATESGADLIATGHYARIEENGNAIQLLKGIDQNKDQSYFLHRLNQEQLSKSLFPIGALQKTEVRELAEKFKLPNSKKKDSQGICFIGKIDVQDFLRENITVKIGDIIDIDSNEIIGNHDGVMFYTIGQREGIGIGGAGMPYYVVSKDSGKNILYVAIGKDNPALYTNTVKFEDIHWINPSDEKRKNISASIRYRHKPSQGVINLSNSEFIFDEPQRAITPGQSIVFYDNDICLGGAIISQQA